MADEKKIKQAQTVFATMCKYLDRKDWKYQKDDENLTIQLTVRGDDLPMEVKIAVNVEKSLISLISFLPFSFPEEKRVEGAIAACVANFRLADGSFDYDFLNGVMLFRMTGSFRESLISEDLIEYLLLVSLTTVDRYNDKMFMVAKNMLSIQDYIKKDEE